jgi:Rrf2 family transcriptional regulator, repressor of oqxAB
MIDLRFPTALQMMQSLVLAERQGMTYVSSAQFAEGLRANPTLVRKLLTTLVQDNLLVSQMGRNGGVRLSRPAERITLREIYEAAVAGKKLWTTRTDLPHRCVVSTNFEHYFSNLVGAADRAVLEILGSQTLAQSFAALEEIDRCGGRTGSAERDPPSAVHLP